MTLYKIGRTINSKTKFSNHNSSSANNIEVIFQFETENIQQVETCLKNKMKPAQYRKYKEIYEVDLDIIKSFIKNCESEINNSNEIIKKNNKKQKAGSKIKPLITHTDKFFMLIPNNKYIQKL